METKTVICDHCQKDLTTAGNCEGYSIRVINRRIPSTGSSVSWVDISPPLEHDLDFCNRSCMDQYFTSALASLPDHSGLTRWLADEIEKELDGIDKGNTNTSRYNAFSEVLNKIKTLNKAAHNQPDYSELCKEIDDALDRCNDIGQCVTPRTTLEKCNAALSIKN